MPKTVLIQITLAGEDTCLLDLYSDSNGCSIPIITDVSVEDLINGYLLEVPDDADEICIRSQSGETCNCSVDLHLPISGTPPPSSTAPGPTPTMTPTPTYQDAGCYRPSIIQVHQSGPNHVLITWGFYPEQCDGYIIQFSRDKITWSSSTGNICSNTFSLYVGDSTGQWYFRIKQLCINGEESEYSGIYSIYLPLPTLSYIHEKICERDCSWTWGNIYSDSVKRYSWTFGMTIITGGTIPVVNGSEVVIFGKAMPPEECNEFPDIMSVLTITITFTDGSPTYFKEVTSEDEDNEISYTFNIGIGNTVIDIVSGCNYT